MIRLTHYINGEFCQPSSGQYLNNINPATGEVYSEIPAGSSEDVRAAFEAAERALLAWATLSPEVRSRYLERIADAIEAQTEELALAETTDTGKPLSLSRKMDIPRAASNFRFFAHAITQFSTEAHLTDGLALNYTRRGPVGVVGCISPWNLPLNLFTWKIAPALAAGNTVVAKPSELAPVTSWMLSKIADEAGLPRGVLNIVYGLGSQVGQAIVDHPGIKAISFTGGTATGRKIAVSAAPMFKKLSLEMGGKNPTVVFADCSFEDAVEGALKSAFTNQGEICLCGSRIYVERPIYDRFLRAFLDKVETLKVGDPLESQTLMGALISDEHLQKVLGYVALAASEGGRVLTGGQRVFLEDRCAKGFFMQPTVIEGLTEDCKVNQEEIFGPVVTIQPFEGLEHAIRLANGTEYGLAASIWTTDLRKAHGVSHALQFGIVWVNTWLLRDLRTPFGGTKLSGVGREGGWEALKFFTEPQNICVRL